MTNNQHRLKNYIKQVRGISYKPHQIVDEPKEGYIPLLRATNIINDELDLDNVLYVEESLVKDEQLLREGDILIAASSGSLSAIGKSASFNNSGKFTFGAFCKVARPININPNYLEHYFKTSVFRQTVQNQINGANIKNIKNEHLDNLTIFVPNSNLQVQVVNLLNTVKNLINKRQSQITALYELTQSLFLEMFGDPVVNSKNILTKKLGDTGELKRGMSKHRPRNAPELLGGPYPLIQTGDVSKAGLFIEGYKSTYSELGLKQSKMWDAGTLCITIAANIAETSILKFDACFPDSVVGYKPNKQMNTIFVHYWFSFLQKIIERNAPESAQKNINLKILNDLEILQPPIERQDEFANKVLEIYKQKTHLLNAKNSMEELYNSLLQKAFKGELFQEQ